MKNKHSNYQKNYRNKLKENGFVRLELQISEKNKELFESMAKEVSTEFVSTSPSDEKKRMKLAKARLFEDLLRSGSHEYFDLKDRLEEKEALISALFPKFGTIETMDVNEAPIPQSVKELTDDSNLQNIIKNLLLEKYRLEQTVKQQKESLIRTNRLLNHYEKQFDQLQKKHPNKVK